MPPFIPHLLLRTDASASHASDLLRSAGYWVTTVRDDEDLERRAADANVDGLVVELSALAAIALVRRIQVTYGRTVVVLVIAAEAESVRRALPSTPVVRPADIDDDLISAIDLALAHEMRRTG